MYDQKPQTAAIVEEEEADGRPTISSEGIEEDRKTLLEGLPLDEQLLLEEAYLLQKLPDRILLTFIDLVGQYAMKLSFLIVAIHLMMLPLILKFVKLQFDASIIPFLYIAPLLVLFPYIITWLWENNVEVISTQFVDERLTEYIWGRHNSAKKRIREEEDALKLFTANSTEYAPEKLKRVAIMRLLTKIDPRMLSAECLNLKKTSKTPLDFGLRQGEDNGNVIGVTKAVIQSFVSNEFTDTNALIDQLRQFQTKIDNPANEGDVERRK